MNSGVLQEKSDSYSCTTFYLVHNQQEPTIPVANFLQTNQQVININDHLSNNLRAYYENNDIVENQMVTLRATDGLVRNVNVQQNCDTRKIDYVILPNDDKIYKEKVPSTSEKLASQSVHVSNANVLYVTDDKTLKKTISNDQISKSSNFLPKKISKKPKTKSLKKARFADRTSVCLLKVGNTYHSVSNLSEEQTKLVSQAIQNINPDNGPIKPTYDTTTNTRVIYKVVSPNDLKVVERNPSLQSKNPREELPMDIDKEEKKDETISNTSVVVETLPQTDNNKKVTRSGRTVKMPKHIEQINEDSHKYRRKPSGNIRCFQCAAEFRGVYQLQRHYEKFPTHTPAKQHSNLFHCLLAIVKSCNIYEKTNVFIQQLELLIGKLKILFPCLLYRSEENVENACTISEDLGRLLGINPGKYNLNMDAIHCIKDTNGYCKHNPQKTVNLKASDLSKPSQLWLTKHKEEIANSDPQIQDCARTNSVDKWPTFNKRAWKIRPSGLNNVNVSSIQDTKKDYNDDNQVNIIEKVLDSHEDAQGLFSINQPITDNVIINNLTEGKKQNNHKVDDLQGYQNSDTDSDISSTPVKFHSAHFDIRSSPIKPTANVFNKIQIRPKIIPKFDLRQPNYTVNETENGNTQNAPDQSLDLPVFTNIQVCNQTIDNGLDSIEIICKENGPINYNSKEWPNNPNIGDLHESYASNNYMDPSMMHISKPVENRSDSNNKDMQRNEHDINEKSCLQNSSVLHLLDTLGKDCLNFPDSELRNNSIDIPLDLFSFNNN